MDRVLLLVDEPLRLLVEALEQLVGEGKHLGRCAHRVRREREKRGAHAPRPDVGDGAVRRVAQVGRRVRRLRLQDDLFDGPGAERHHDVVLDLLGMELMALQLRCRHDDAVRVAHADDRRLLDAVVLVEVMRGDRVTGLVVRDGAAVMRRHAEDRLLDAEQARIARGEPVLVRQVLAPGIVGDDERLVDHGLQIDRRPADRVRDHEVDRDLRVMRLEAQVVLEDVLAALTVRLVDHELAVQATGAHESRVQHVGPVGRADDEHDGLRRNRAADESEPTRDLVLHAIFDVLTQ